MSKLIGGRMSNKTCIDDKGNIVGEPIKIKELTPSQALNDLIDGLEDEHIGSSEEEWVVKRKQIIEAALLQGKKDRKELEEIKNAISNGTFQITWSNMNSKEYKALEIIKVLFKSRVRLYTRSDGIEQTIDNNGNYRKFNCDVYILEFYAGDLHYVFHLHKDEYDLLKEVLL